MVLLSAADVVDGAGTTRASAHALTCRSCALAKLLVRAQTAGHTYVASGADAPVRGFGVVCWLMETRLLTHYGVRPVEHFPHAFRRDVVEHDMRAHRAKSRPPLRQVTAHHVVQGPPRPMLVLVPEQVTLSDAGVALLVLWVHGGAFVFGAHDSQPSVDLLSRLAREAGVLCASVSYRLNPEHLHADMVADVEQALLWLCANAVKAPWFPAHARGVQVVTAGESAGANLALSVTHLQRTHVARSVLLYPVTNIHTLDTPSWRTLGAPGTNFMFKRTDAQRLMAHLFADHQREACHPRASPMLETNWAGVPPVHCIAGELDPLCDDAVEYCRLASQHGVHATLTVYARCTHGWLSYPMPSPQRTECLLELVSILRSTAQQPVADGPVSWKREEQS